MAIFGAIMAIGALFGTSVNSSALVDPIRWLVVILCAAIAGPMAFQIATAADALNIEPAVPAFGFFYACLGGILGYWHAKGQVT